MKNFFKKIKIILKRKKNAKKIGIQFTRAAAWRMPEKILINNRFINPAFSNDNATSTSFVDIFLDDVYGLYFFQSYLPGISCIADIGANQGLFILAARNVFLAEIHGYEPNSSVLKQLKYHADFAGAKYYNEAVGLVNGRIEMETKEDSLHGKTRLSETGHIPQVSLGDVISRLGDKIDLLKLDCEGAEWEILKDKTSLKKVRAITLEYHLDETHDHTSIKEVLKDVHFEILHYEVSGLTWGIVWAVNKAFN